MVHLVEKIQVSYPDNMNDNYLPENIQKNKWYTVICEKTGIRKDNKNKDRGKIEDIYFGIINEDDKLVFGASFNFKVRIKGEDGKKDEHF